MNAIFDAGWQRDMEGFGDLSVDCRDRIGRIARLWFGTRVHRLVIPFAETPKAITVEIVNSKFMLNIRGDTAQ